MIKKLLVLCSYLLLIGPNLSWALPLSELLNFRAAKAELAIVDGKYTQALKILRFNLTRKVFHLDSYDLLAEIYLKRGNIAKAMRVYYYIIKKEHTGVLLNVQSFQQLKEMLSNVPVPKQEALLYYKKIANLYYKLYNDGAFKKSFQRKLLAHAKKYFLICKYFHYDLATTLYSLSMIEREEERYKDSLDYLFKAKAFVENNGNISEIENMNFILADTLMKVGKQDAGTLFLKKIVAANGGDSSLKQYAQNYLNSLHTKYMGMNFSYTKQYDSNVNQLNDRNLEHFDPDTFHAKSSTYTSISASIYYMNYFKKYFNYTISTQFNSFKYSDFINNLDNRSYAVMFDLNYTNFQKSLGRISVSLNQSDGRENNKVNGRFQKVTQVLDIRFDYGHALKRGTIHYAIPISMTNNYQSTKFDYESYSYFFTAESTKNYGFEISYEPYTISDLFSPTYTISIMSVGEVSDISGNPVPNSKLFNFSIGNNSVLSARSSLYSSLAISNYMHQLDSYSYTGANIGLYYTKHYNHFMGVSLNINTSIFYRKFLDSNVVKGYTLSLGIAKSI